LFTGRLAENRPWAAASLSPRSRPDSTGRRRRFARAGRVVGCLDVQHARRRPAARRRRRRPRPGRGHHQGDPRRPRDPAAWMTTSKSPAAAAIRSSIRRALQSDDQQPVPITDLQAAINDEIATLDRLERAVEGPAGRRSAAARPHSRREGRGPGRRGPHRVVSETSGVFVGSARPSAPRPRSPPPRPAPSTACGSRPARRGRQPPARRRRRADRRRRVPRTSSGTGSTATLRSPACCRPAPWPPPRRRGCGRRRRARPSRRLRPSGRVPAWTRLAAGPDRLGRPRARGDAPCVVAITLSQTRWRPAERNERQPTRAAAESQTTDPQLVIWSNS